MELTTGEDCAVKAQAGFKLLPTEQEILGSPPDGRCQDSFCGKGRKSLNFLINLCLRLLRLLLLPTLEYPV
jgi:hypothetical protein